MSSSVRPSGALEDAAPRAPRCRGGGRARACPRSAASAIAWSFSVRRNGALEVARRCSPCVSGPVAVGRAQLGVRRSPRCRRARAARSPAPPAVCGVVAADEPVGGEDGQARVLRARRGTSARSGARPRRRSPRRRRARSRSGGGRRRSAARRRLERAPGPRRSPSGSATRQRRLTVPSSSVGLAERLGRRCGRERAPGGAVGVVVEAEDRREVRLRRAREAQPVLLGPGVRALVRADAARGRSPRRARARRTPRRVSARPSGPV